MTIRDLLRRGEAEILRRSRPGAGARCGPEEETRP